VTELQVLLKPLPTRQRLGYFAVSASVVKVDYSLFILFSVCDYVSFGSFPGISTGVR
jgi:hypothetical protein